MMRYAVIALAVSSVVFAADDGFCSTGTTAPEVERILPIVNNQIGKTTAVDPFKISFLPRIALVFQLPFHAYLETTTAGTMANLNSLKQDMETYSQCDKNSHVRDMDGRLEFGSVEVTFDKVKAGFWYFEFEGKMVYKFNPIVPFRIHQDATTCGLPSSSKLGYGVGGSSSLKFEPTSGLGFVSWITSFLLQYGDAYGALISPYEKHIDSIVSEQFIKYWCDNHHAP
ncbi:hypothetical protein GE061_014150 [Apolygus lucorum]|uniref:Uncharacterized protein n=1 Tax=Apolygus lucorum TaxID=248454 RepID=A0A6A4KBY1_APOLU|nr:hypothetical protein GE061_014150 [Apolygus lucorum]